VFDKISDSPRVIQCDLADSNSSNVESKVEAAPVSVALNPCEYRGNEATAIDVLNCHPVDRPGPASPASQSTQQFEALHVHTKINHDDLRLAHGVGRRVLDQDLNMAEEQSEDNCGQGLHSAMVIGLRQTLQTSPIRFSPHTRDFAPNARFQGGKHQQQKGRVPPYHREPKTRRNTRNSVLVDDDSDQEWEVEAIVGPRKQGKSPMRYQVKWKDWSEEHNTWMKASGLRNAKEMLDAYHAKYLAGIGHHCLDNHCVQNCSDDIHHNPRSTKRRSPRSQEDTPRSQKRTKSRECPKPDATPTHDASDQVNATNKPRRKTGESEEIPIRGFLKLESNGSEVIYHVKFSCNQSMAT
jgi:Chromo (CHRromatin Organisation MOdifier) domain